MTEPASRLPTSDTEVPPSTPSATSPEWHRLSTPFALRLLGGVTVSAVAGFTLGVSQGGRMAGLRFRAENAHRQPHTTPGWYLYHKSKNYHVVYGGIIEGIKMSGRCALWAGTFFTVEEAVDHLRGRKDFVSSVIAGLGCAGAFSAWKRFPLHTAVRTARMSLYFGLGYGLAQDMLALLRGHRIGYVDFVGQRARRLFAANEVSDRGINASGDEG